MRHNITSIQPIAYILAIAALAGLAQGSLASSATSPARAPAGSEDIYKQSQTQACAFLKDARMNRNCISLFVSPWFLGNRIARDAVTYSLAYLAANENQVQDMSCAKRSAQKAGLPTSIKNKCSFVVNNVENSIAGFPLRSQAYYVDLCSTEVYSVVRKFNAKKGVGPTYLDVNEKNSTVAGVFLTDDKVRGFTGKPKKNGKESKEYAALRRTMPKGFIPALDLTPMQSTNDDSSDDKPVHVSPYNSSFGCPSIDKSDADIIYKLAQNGPSMWINYGNRSLHPSESITKCDAVPEVKTQSTKAIKQFAVQNGDEAGSAQ